MFYSKKKKIEKYLDNISENKELTAFDELLADYLSGELKTTLTEIGIERQSIYIDWSSNYKCINIQGVHNQNYVDLQIEPITFSIGYDPIEPDEHIFYTLESKQQLYNELKTICEGNKSESSDY